MAGNEQRRVSRRQVLQLGTVGLLAPALGVADTVAFRPRRTAQAAPTGPPAIQFDIGDYVAPAEEIDGTLFRFGPVFTLFVTGRLARTPIEADQRALAAALATIEEHYPFSPAGVFTAIGYGVPYFNRLPGGLAGPTVAAHMPRLLLDHRRYALEEAVPAPTDVSPESSDIAKQTFNVPVAIEQNDLVLTLRSDARENLTDVLAWLLGSGVLNGAAVPPPPLGDLIEITSTRLMFVQRGLPRRLAEVEGLPYAARIHPDSPLWMSFASQQADSSGLAAVTTFAGNASAQFTDARPGDYFAEASVQHLSHVILDLEQWYGDDEPYLERVQHMFRSNPVPASGNPDQFADGGGPAFLPNVFQGRDDARQNAVGFKTQAGDRRLGHTTALQRAARAGDGSPIHIRVDGAGYDSLDVPDGTNQPKLHFSMFVPSAEVFERMRRYQAGTDLAQAYGVTPAATGLERFTTTTRRQNFLVPPRQARAFPLLELA